MIILNSLGVGGLPICVHLCALERLLPILDLALLWPGEKILPTSMFWQHSTSIHSSPHLAIVKGPLLWVSQGWSFQFYIRCWKKVATCLCPLILAKRSRLKAWPPVFHCSVDRATFSPGATLGILFLMQKCMRPERESVFLRLLMGSVNKKEIRATVCIKQTISDELGCWSCVVFYYQVTLLYLKAPNHG